MLLDGDAAAGDLRALHVPPAADAAEINAMVARIAKPDVLTGMEVAERSAEWTWPRIRWRG